MKKYTVKAKIVSVVKTLSGDYHIVFQRIDTIQDKYNPFDGQRKMAVSSLNIKGVSDMMKLFKVVKVSKLLHKHVVLTMTNDGSIFEKVVSIAVDPIFGFRAIPQALPKFVMRDADMTKIALGEMYV